MGGGHNMGSDEPEAKTGYRGQYPSHRGPGQRAQAPTNRLSTRGEPNAALGHRVPDSQIEGWLVVSRYLCKRG